VPREGSLSSRVDRIALGCVIRSTERLLLQVVLTLLSSHRGSELDEISAAPSARSSENDQRFAMSWPQRQARPNRAKATSAVR